MSSVYQALERARRGGAAPPPGGSAPRAADRRFGREMQALTSRLQQLFDERPSVALAITACGRGEGTTTLATEFAAHLAEDGRRVLFCGVHSRADKRDDGDAAVEEVAPNLFLIDIGQLRRGSTNVLDKSVFRDRVELLRKEYDVVLIDCPPILIDGSWSALLRAADGIILVVEAERTRAAVLRSTTKMISEVGGHVLGIVFNRRRQYIPRFLYRFL